MCLQAKMSALSLILRVQAEESLHASYIFIQDQDAQGRLASGAQQSAAQQFRFWQDVPILVMVSMLAYFCFLELLLVTDLQSRAIAISLPFSCVLGLLSSLIASTMETKSYLWAYSSFQFAIVILFSYIFYNVLRVNAVLAVLLSSFTGFGIAISTNSLLVECMRWSSRRRSQRLAQAHPQPGNEGQHPGSGSDATSENGGDRQQQGQPPQSSVHIV